MSAWMVSPLRVALLVHWYDTEANTHRLPLMPEGRVKLANMLHRENALSVNARYPDQPASLPHLFSDRELGYNLPQLSPVEAIKAAQCLEYQSCEHDGWEKSDARKFCDAVIHAAIALLPGYDSAPWGIEESDLIAAVQS